MSQTSPTQPEASADTIRVLIAEDDPAVARLFAREVARAGYQVIGPEAEGMRACELGLCEQVHAAIIDIGLADQVTGLDVAEVLQREQDAAIVFVSGHSDPDVVLAAGRRCDCGYLVKPVDPDALTAVLAHELELAAWRRAEHERLQRPATAAELDAMLAADDEDVRGPMAQDAFETARRIYESCLLKAAEHGLRLPPQQARVATQMALGLSRAEIAKKVGLSPHTVDSYLKLIYQRTRLRDRRSLAFALVGSAVEQLGTEALAPAPDRSARAEGGGRALSAVCAPAP